MTGTTTPEGATPSGAFALADIDCRSLIPADLVVHRAARTLSIRCLWHHDRNPSCSVYADGAYCHACEETAGPLKLYMRLYDCTLEQARVALTLGLTTGTFATATDADRVRQLATPPQDLGRQLHQGLTDAAMAYYVEERGLWPETVSQFQLGWGALYAEGPAGYTVPIYQHGKLRQVKQRLPGLTQNKYRSVTGCGSWLFLGDDLGWEDNVILAGGEFDAIAARQYGYRAAAPTSGEKRFDRAWLRMLEGTTPYCAYDADARGEEGYRHLRHLLKGGVKRVRLPVKDLTEFFLTHDPAELQQLMAEADDRFVMGE